MDNGNISAQSRLNQGLEPNDHISDFGEAACGEPLTPQRLVLDFTPNSGDTDFVQKKCCAFWDFISTCPELEHWRVVPEAVSDVKSKSSDVELAMFRPDLQQTENLKTAVSMLEFVEEKGLITRTFEAKLPNSGCSVGSMDYFDNKSNVSALSPEHKVCNCKGVCKSCKAKSFQEQRNRLQSSKVLGMCKELQDWDVQHPKSMDPPGHPPELDEL